MTSDPPTTRVSAACPTCGATVEAETDRDDNGFLHIRPVSLSQLRKHMDCDIWRISVVLSQAATAQSKVHCFTIKGE